MPSGLSGSFKLDKVPRASDQKVVVTMERRWMIQRQAERGQAAIGEAHSSQAGVMPEASGAGQVSRDVHQTKATYRRLRKLPKDNDARYRLPLYTDLYSSAESGPPKCTPSQKLADIKVLALWPSASSQEVEFWDVLEHTGRARPS